MNEEMNATAGAPVSIIGDRTQWKVVAYVGDERHNVGNARLVRNVRTRSIDDNLNASSAAPVSPIDERTHWKMVVCFEGERHCVGKVLLDKSTVTPRKRSYAELDDNERESVRQLGPLSLKFSHQIPNHPRDILEDVDGSKRGVFLCFEDDEHMILRALMEAYTVHENKLACVQKYTPFLLHHMVSRPGFPFTRGSDIGSSRTNEMEVFLSLKLKRALSNLGYCSNDHDIEWYLSFLKTERTQVQPPHIDFQWKDVSPRQHEKVSRSKIAYKDWLPFIAVCPLTHDGMTMEVWNARSAHDQPECNEDATGVMVHVPYGQLLILRWDVIHAGGFCTAASGNPRCHFYIYKKPGGALHAYPASNCYHVEIGRQHVPMVEYYHHCAESATTSIVTYQQAKTRESQV